MKEEIIDQKQGNGYDKILKLWPAKGRIELLHVGKML